MEAGSAEEFKHIVRIANTDLDGSKKVQYALTAIKGIGRRVSRVIALKAGVDPDAILGELPDEVIKRIEDVIENINDHLPSWMKNRRRDIYTGEDLHIIGAELDLVKQEDIELLKRIRSYRGIRHEKGYKVRGQRTRSTGRKGPAVGVSRKKK